MRTILFFILVAVAAIPAFSQTDLEKLIATERAFAALAAKQGTKYAFLSNLADDGLVFVPDRINGKQYWKARGESPGLLSWAPNYADISSNGLLGYTTGNWEYRAKGKDDAPSAFGEFITLWQRMPNGEYKFVLDIGVSHEKPANYSTEVAPPSYRPSPNEENSSAADSANRFFEVAAASGLPAAYKMFAADSVRAYRENSFPILGKGRLLSLVKKDKAKTTMPKRSFFFGSADIAYITNAYDRTSKDGTVERGNFLQIWKLVGGRWQIVLDVFKSVPQK